MQPEPQSTLLGGIVTLNYGKALVASDRGEGTIPVYGTNGQCGWHTKSLGDGPTVVLGRKGMGNLGVEWCPGPFWVIDTAYYVTPKIEDLDLLYFYYWAKAHRTQPFKGWNVQSFVESECLLRSRFPPSGH